MELSNPKTTSNQIKSQLHPICSIGMNDVNVSRIDYLRKTFNVTVPYTEDELRQSAINSNNYSTVYQKWKRQEYYSADPNFQSHKAPLLMDGFSYCDGSTLVVEILMNLRYMIDEEGKEKAYSCISDTWICTHQNVSVSNWYVTDPYKNVIILVFNFTNQCITANESNYSIRALNNGFNYSLNLEFLPHFKTQRYYLSMCVFLDNAPERQVTAFINHYFFHGVQHFIFNINGNLEYWTNVLKEYSNHGIVDVIDYTFPNRTRFHEQLVVMNSCNRRNRFSTKFLIQCDVDEFFLPLNPKWRIVDVVRLYDIVYPEMDAFNVRCFSYC